jgi:ribonuclease P protein component
LLPRLKTAEQFAAVLDASKQKGNGGGVWRSEHFVLHMAPFSTLTTLATLSPSPLGAARPIIGVICPKRWAKRAVTRNTIKRQIYAVTHELANQLPADCLVLRLAAGFSREEFTSATSAKLKMAVRQELCVLLGKIARPATVSTTTAAA